MEVKHATFEYVQNCQDQFFFDFLDEFIKHEETVDFETRREYFKLLADSFLGVEKNYRYMLKYNGGFYDLGSLASYSRKMTYIEDKDLLDGKKVEIDAKGKILKVPIVVLWKSLRDSFYEATAEALNLSLRTSAEMVTREGGVYEFELDKKIGEK